MQVNMKARGESEISAPYVKYEEKTSKSNNVNAPRALHSKKKADNVPLSKYQTKTPKSESSDSDDCRIDDTVLKSWEETVNDENVSDKLDIRKMEDQKSNGHDVWRESTRKLEEDIDNDYAEFEPVDRQSLKRRSNKIKNKDAVLFGKSSINPSRISSMTFNNQDTVLLRAETEVHICFLHDNRIFFFRKNPSTDDQKGFIIRNPNCDEEYDKGEVTSFESLGESVEEICVKLILHLMTTPKYRLLNSTYIVFTTIDQWIFISIVVMIIVGYGTQNREEFSVSEFAWSIPITMAVMLEVFVGITMNTRSVLYLIKSPC